MPLTCMFYKTFDIYCHHDAHWDGWDVRSIWVVDKNRETLHGWQWTTANIPGQNI